MCHVTDAVLDDWEILKRESGAYARSQFIAGYIVAEIISHINR